MIEEESGVALVVGSDVLHSDRPRVADRQTAPYFALMFQAFR
jgi:hypothetical protein